MNNPEYFTHPQALVDKGAKIGRESRVWAFAHVLSGAVIGEHCNIGDYAFVESGAKLGNWVTVKNGVQIWEGVTAEDGVFLGPNCVFTNDMLPRSFLKPPKESWLVPTLLKQGCSIGANATIIGGHSIGRFAYVVAGAVVTRDVPDFAMVMGAPARHYAWICRCVTKLEFGKDRKSKCGKCGGEFELSGDGKAVTELRSGDLDSKV